MLARTRNQKPCDLAQFETTVRRVLPAACISCRACHVRYRHDGEPEERSKLNRNKYNGIVTAQIRLWSCTWTSRSGRWSLTHPRGTAILDDKTTERAVLE